MQWLLDGFVILLYFVAVLGIGIYKGRGSKTMESFAIGNRDIPWWAVLASIIAAETSAATFLGAPNEGYAHRNFTYAQLALGTVLARVIIAFVFLKPYYDYRVVSIYDFLRVRFGTRTKNVASGLFLFTRALASGTRLYVAAVVLVLAYEMITGVELTLMQQLWVYIGSLTFLSVITAIYTTIGGIKAVVWTDVIQATVMFGALGFAIWLLLTQIPGGLNGALAILQGPKDLAFFDSGIQPGVSFLGNVRGILESDYTIWSALLGATFLTMATHGTDQDMVQRMLTAKNYTKSRLALIGSGLADIPLVLCFLAVGVLLWALYQDPEKLNPFAYYILHGMPPGVRGLLIAGVFATAMGSLSTALNALATSFTEDFYLPYIRPGATQAQIVRTARWGTVIFSILLIIIGSVTAYAAIVLQARIIPIVLGIFGYTYGSLLGIFLIGMLTRTRGSEVGNLIAMFIGFVVVALFSGLHNDIWVLFHPIEHEVPLWQPDWLVRVTFPWRIMIGTIVTVAVGLLFRTPNRQVELAREHVARQADKPMPEA
ncbi:MAG TPA: sodium:solute symporter [Chthoniobacteraceae bacterium]|nr:sodium:solute symporter [Chthoniobacteraceae bacterium]